MSRIIKRNLVPLPVNQLHHNCLLTLLKANEVSCKSLRLESFSEIDKSSHRLLILSIHHHFAAELPLVCIVEIQIELRFVVRKKRFNCSIWSLHQTMSIIRA